MTHRASVGLLGNAIYDDSGRRRSSLASIAQTFTRSSKINIEIDLSDEQQGAFVPSYTTLEKIQGTVSVTASIDSDFSDIHVTFQGSSRTFIEKIATSATSSRSQAHHNFLRLIQPLNDSDIPEGRTLKAGKTYKFPFTFVVPEELLPQSCTHSASNAHIAAAHLALPPSLGDPMMASDGKSLLDDLAPANAVVSYALRVIITKRTEESGGRPSILCDKLRKLRIIPAVPEHPPLTVSPNHEDSDYVLTKSKMLKKGLFKGKLGLLTVEAAQPKSLRLPPLRTETDVPITTAVVINLRFDPADPTLQPPRLSQLWNRLKVITYFSSVPMKHFPSKSQIYINDVHHGLYPETVPLSSRCVESAQWTAHKVDLSRKDSAISFAGSPTGDSSDSDSTPTTIFYSSQIIAPIDLPICNKTFVPSFHSCLVSRVYALDFTLSIHTSGSSVSNPSMHLRIPLQISAEPNPDARPTISAEEAAAIAAREFNNDLLPRSVAPPSPEYIERAELAPFARRHTEPDLHQSSTNYEHGEEPRPRDFGSMSAVPDYSPTYISRSSSSLAPGPPVPSELPPEYSATGGRVLTASMEMGRPQWANMVRMRV